MFGGTCSYPRVLNSGLGVGQGVTGGVFGVIFLWLNF